MIRNIIASFVLFISFNSFSQNSVVYFYRLKSLAFASTNAGITINDTMSISLENGSYKKVEFSNVNDSIRLGSSLTNKGISSLKAEKGKTHYVQVEVLSPVAVEFKLQTEFSGKPAIERLDADKLAEESENLPSVKITGVEPLPQTKEDQALIYLFRPFNVTGVTMIAHVSDGTKIYEMKNNSSTVLVKDAGEIIFRTVNEGKNTSNTTLKLKVEKGKIYYVAVLRSGGALVLTETKEEYAKQEMKLQQTK